MAQFTVDKNVRVVITSSVNAAYKQHFIVERQSTTKPGWWEGMGNRIYKGGETASFLPFSEITIWKVTCQNDNGHNVWVNSRERLYGVGTSHITLNCDDDNSGDGDFNDIIVQIYLGYNDDASISGIVPDETIIDKSNDKPGDGNFKQEKHKPIPLDPDPGKGHMVH